ncbi:histidine kinase [soil metagenome]
MRWQGWGRTAFLVTVATLVVTGQVQVWGQSEDPHAGRVVHALLLLVCTASLLAARRFPLSVLLLVMTSATVHYWLGGNQGQPWFALVMAVYALGARGTPRSSAIGMLVVAVGILSIDAPRLQSDEPLDEFLPAWFILAGSWGFGRWMHHRGRDHAELVARTEAVEQDRETATRAAVTHERARIARELHEVVAHSLSVIVLQAQAGERVLATDPAGTRRALGSIEAVGRQGLEELRRLLQVRLDTDDAASLDPAPSLRHLDLLVERVRAAGLPVEVTVGGSSRPLPPGVDVSAYRIVQEALTNTLKHSGADCARVDLHYREGSVEVQVTDNGSGGGQEDSQHVGHGLIGMRERVALYGGTLDTGRQPAGGFRVLARLPLAVSR